MQVEEDRRGDIVILRVVGEFDVAALPAFEGRLDGLVADGVRGVLWDLEGCGLLASTGVGFLLQTGGRLRAVGGAMALASAGRRARSTLQTLGVLDVFSLLPTREAGLEHLRRRLA
ncbi:MAG: STAS domain-containing protein [Planctomycetota bacterium]